MNDGSGSGWLDWLKKLFGGKSEATQQSSGDQAPNIGPVSGGVVTIHNYMTVTHVTNATAPVAAAAAPEQGGAVTQVKRVFIEKTLVEVTDDIASVPPLQRDEKAKHYVGLWVQWELELANLSPQGERYSSDEPKTHARLQFCEDGPGYVDQRFAYAVVKQADVPGLGLRDRGDFGRVVGRIESAEKSGVQLEEVELEFIERPPALQEGDHSAALPEGSEPKALPAAGDD